MSIPPRRGDHSQPTLRTRCHFEPFLREISLPRIEIFPQTPRDLGAHPQEAWVRNDMRNMNHNSPYAPTVISSCLCEKSLTLKRDFSPAKCAGSK